jgi:hypothetical protein
MFLAGSCLRQPALPAPVPPRPGPPVLAPVVQADGTGQVQVDGQSRVPHIVPMAFGKVPPVLTFFVRARSLRESPALFAGGTGGRTVQGGSGGTGD